MKLHCKFDELVDIRELKSHPKNRNSHSKEQIERLAKILEYQGMRAPLVVDRNKVIHKGHGTLMAIKKNGWDKAPIVYQDFENEEQSYAFVQSDNAIASWSELDLSGINLDIQDLGPDFDIDLLGIKGFEIDVADREIDEKELDENIHIDKECPSCGYKWS
jgi:hypothetical protein